MPTACFGLLAQRQNLCRLCSPTLNRPQFDPVSGRVLGCGLKLDRAVNQSPPLQGGRISATGGKIEIAVIRIGEAQVMAQAAADLLTGN
ncbi:MAG: hypothetical protein ABL951_03845 [Alphaproteobacteria bacterium]